MSEDETTGVPHFLDDVQLIERKRVRLDSAGRKRWSLTDRQSDQEVMDEMGVGLLVPDDADAMEVASCSHGAVKSETKRKRNIENESPNVDAPGRVRTARWRHKHSSLSPNTESVHWSDEHVLSERSLNEAYDPTDEETPLPLVPVDNIHSKRHTYSSPAVCSSTESSNWTSVSSRERLSMVSSSPGTQCLTSPDNHNEDCACTTPSKETAPPAKDLLQDVSDEVMLHIFKWLPKRCLVRCTLVCRRWHRIASDESLWQRLELGERNISSGALGLVLAKKPVVLRLAGADVGEWRRPAELPPSRLQYLDLSMCTLEPATLNSLLRCCPALRRLSLETVGVDGRTCQIIGECKRLETLNMTMATGLEPKGLKALLEGCTALQSLNISWCLLSTEAAQVVCESAPVRMQRLNLAGTRLLTDEMLGCLVSRCAALQELDISDCTKLTEAGLAHVTQLDRLEHLAISRCYLLAPLNIAQIQSMPALQYLDVWGMLPTTSLATLRVKLSNVSINQFMLSAIARPTVGPRRTSIWGIRTRD